MAASYTIGSLAEPRISWLTALRIGLGLQLVLYCITSRADWLQMFTLHPGSFVTRDLTEALVTLGAALVPRVSWFISAGEFIGLSEATVLWVVWSGAPGCGPLSGRRDILSERSDRRLVPSSFCN